MNANFQNYWDKRYSAEGKIWGDKPSLSAGYAAGIFGRENVKSILVPGSGYGRNTRYFSELGFAVTGIEISTAALAMAGHFDPQSRFLQGSVLEMPFDNRSYDAIYCFNVLHLFLESDRKRFITQCADRVKPGGCLFFTVFSEKEANFGEGQEVEKNTFETRPGRPAHYFTEVDLQEHFQEYQVMDSGLMDDPEDHGGQAHTHHLRFIFLRR
jgi:SAM-dependent methyltransferase